MPQGVEHKRDIPFPQCFNQVKLSLMPQGVEHIVQPGARKAVSGETIFDAARR